MTQKTHLKNLTLSAMFLAIGLLLPLLTAQIPQIGRALLPMHIPVLLCGLICGWPYGLVVGAVTPLLRCLIFGMPDMATAVTMAPELAAYGLVAGLLYGLFRRKNLLSVYCSMLTAMVAGRLVWGAAKAIMMGLGETGFTFQMFLAGAVLNAIPGIIVQLILIPAIMVVLDRTGLVPFTKKAAETVQAG